MNDNKNGLQDIFLNACRKEKVEVTVYLSNGVKLSGIVGGFDNFVMVLRRGSQTQLVYKHSISTIVPSKTIDTFPGKDAIDDGNEINNGEAAPFQIA